MHPLPCSPYQVGGRLPVDAPSYVARKADERLFQALKAGEFCYVLNSRQMGKSSLRVHVAQRLTAAGIACATVDLSGIGNRGITIDQWYADIIMRLVRGLGLAQCLSVRDWLYQRQDLSPVHRLGDFFQDLPLHLCSPVVIFFDEIDSTLSLPFDTDDFFTLLRSYHEQAFLTFALLGVATPSSLIRDKARTPFNLGHAIALNGFQLEEVEPLTRGLMGVVDNPQAVLQEILQWTGGQPFLTQKLCQLVAEQGGKIEMSSEGDSPYLTQLVRELLTEHGEIATQIETLVQSKIIENWVAQDEPPHLRTIRDRLLYQLVDGSVDRKLDLYEQILQSGSIVADDSDEQRELLLSGLVVKQQGCLKLYNKIYGAIFNLAWIAKQRQSSVSQANDYPALIDRQNQMIQTLQAQLARFRQLAWIAVILALVILVFK
jgi:AAA-like domain